MLRLVRRVLPLAAAVALVACGRDATSPDAARSLAPGAPAALIGPNEGIRTVSESTDAAGNITTVAEYPAGVYTLPNGDQGSVASVTIRTVVPGTPASSKTCITSTVVGTETTPGWTSSVRKSGGCNKDIEVQFDNAGTRQRAKFSFSMVPGKTRIDFGAVE